MPRFYTISSSDRSGHCNWKGFCGDILIDGHTNQPTSKRINVQKVIYKDSREKRKMVDVYFLKGLKADF